MDAAGRPAMTMLLLLFLNSLTPVQGRALFSSLDRAARSDDPNPLEELVMQLSQTVNQQQAQLTALNNQVTQLNARLTQQETKVAFSVRLSGNTVFHNPDIVVFDVVDLNMGGNYDTVTGMFTAPVSGLYQFSMKITDTPPGFMHVIMLAGGQQVAEVEVRGEETDRSSASVAVRLARGSRVWLRKDAGTASQVEGNFRSSFTGVLIRPDPPSA